MEEREKEKRGGVERRGREIKQGGKEILKRQLCYHVLLSKEQSQVPLGIVLPEQDVGLSWPLQGLVHSKERNGNHRLEGSLQRTSLLCVGIPEDAHGGVRRVWLSAPFHRDEN